MDLNLDRDQSFLVGMTQDSNGMNNISGIQMQEQSLIMKSMKQKKQKNLRYMQPTKSSNKKVDITMQSFSHANLQGDGNINMQSFSTTIDNLMNENSMIK
jgi:hypothetical protein